MDVQGNAGGNSLKAPRILFRADASINIGTGHVMRCLTLADELARRGAVCRFVCRPLSGNLIGEIEKRGYGVSQLPTGRSANSGPQHASWLEASWQEDAEQTGELLDTFDPHWLVVDHYALDYRWQTRVRKGCGSLMVIDDLADRRHICDVLLDQNLGREAADYRNLIPENCELLIGPKFALLRPEFAEMREFSIARRSVPGLRRILVSLGGVDKDDVTSSVLDALHAIDLPAECSIVVVMGPHAPWLARVRDRAAKMRRPTEVRVNVSNMAQLMADCDLAIGAAGTTTWERACLGLPTLTVVVADNQQAGAAALERAGCIRKLVLSAGLADDLKAGMTVIADSVVMGGMTQHCVALTDGGGAGLIAARLVERG